MHIILGEENVKKFQDKYVVLELDTLQFQPSNQEISTYCLVENVPINDLYRVENMKALHANLIANYRKQDWNYCEQAIENLLGFWGGEVDSFYQDLQNRISELKTQELDQSWDWRISKQLNLQ